MAVWSCLAIDGLTSRCDWTVWIDWQVCPFPLLQWNSSRSIPTLVVFQLPSRFHSQSPLLLHHSWFFFFQLHWNILWSSWKQNFASPTIKILYDPGIKNPFVYYYTFHSFSPLTPPPIKNINKYVDNTGFCDSTAICQILNKPLLFYGVCFGIYVDSKLGLFWAFMHQVGKLDTGQFYMSANEALILW